MIISVSVRNLVEFLLRNGDLDNRKAGNAQNAMLEGSRIHRKIQSRMGSNYRAEVSLRYEQENDQYTLAVEGRADGIYVENDKTYIDEIKTTFREMKKIHAADPIHLAQAKCYAYIYALQENIEKIYVRISYCNQETEEMKFFYEECEFVQLEEWFLGLLSSYKVWTDYEFEWKNTCLESVRKMEFPFPYREGQKDLVTYTYQTIYHARKLFIEAPTGVGKTISTVFPAVKSMGEGLTDKIFYLTAKTITRTVADNTFSLLREKGLQFKTIILTAKEKICFLEEPECNPVACPYAKGHFDRINEAIFDIITHEHSFTREKIEEYAQKHQVCPFEFCLDVSLFSDGIIGDYNYLFDPHVYLKRFFADEGKRKYVFLIDEAHNLLDRGRNMYSAVLCKEDFLELKRIVKDESAVIASNLEKCNKELLMLKRQCNQYVVEPDINDFVKRLVRLTAVMEDYLEDHEEGEIRKQILDFYFEVSHFNMIYELMDEKYVVYTQVEADGTFTLHLFNVDPSKNLGECMHRGRTSILFSATLLPIQYYKNLLGGTKEDYEVYAKSTFDPEKRGLFICNDVTSKYTRRNEEEYRNIASYIHSVTRERTGNYMVFFPSHAFLKNVLEMYSKLYPDGDVECLVQESNMSEEKREAFLHKFEGNPECNLNDEIQFPIEVEEEKTLIGFCVMGGLFSEGIDLKNDALIGAIIVGTGVPQVCNENEILKNYFDEKDGRGFDYAYRYPGMNKVLQASGRVIRTHEDVGLVALLDERFLSPAYQKMFPREWEHFEVVSNDIVGKRVARFWDEWLPLL